MKPFHTVAVPHDDVLAGRLTMDVFAADLWEVHKGRGPDEYRDPEQFFHKTYKTEGLRNLLTVIEKRLQGQGGDPFIQVQTPFGGGKTHSLIAMYHKASEWRAKKVVIAGTAMSTTDTPWGMMEEQLTGSKEQFTGKVSPGREAIYNLLNEHQPVLILMDELLQYVTKAAGVKVEDSTLGAQTMAFMQELTEVTGTLEKVCLVVTLPSSLTEHYDERAERLFQQLQKVSGRVEKIYTPVQEHEITNVIRQRLFSHVDTEHATKNIQEYMEYLSQESLLPPGVELSEYRNRFRESYPFLPEVINVLYHRWGSFASFQRTRGVLRLLSLVLYSLKDQPNPYITLADFNLGNQEIRRELLKHIGPEFDSVIAADITDSTAGAKQVDNDLGKAYQGLGLGSRTATSIFMHSFSGGPERGCGLGEIKRNATTTENPSSVIAEAIEQLKGRLFYLQTQNGKYFFTNQPNLNKILLVKMENIEPTDLIEFEKNLLKQNISGSKLKVFLWPDDDSDVQDDQNLKLVVLSDRNSLIDEILTRKGSNPRVNKNTIIFLVPNEGEQTGFYNVLRKYMAYERILDDKTLNLSEDQLKHIKSELSSLEDDLNESLRRYYRQILLPSKSGLREIDLGIPTYGEKRKLDEVVYEKLRMEGEVLERVVPLVIKEKYLQDKAYVLTEQLYTAGLTTPGETRAVDQSVWENGIGDGVRQGLFGLGEVEDGEPTCHYFEEEPSVGLTGNEIIIRQEICKQQKEEAEPPVTTPPETGISTPEGPGGEQPGTEGESTTLPGGTRPEEPHRSDVNVKERVHLRFPVPKGKVASLMGILNLLQSKFSKLELEVLAEEGGISEQEYEDKIKETFRQLDINIEE